MPKSIHISRVVWIAIAAVALPAGMAAAPINYFASVFNYTNVNQYFQRSNNGTFATASGMDVTRPQDGQRSETVAGTADLPDGQLRVLNTGFVIPSATDVSDVMTAAQSTVGDTITAQGSTSGFNLRLNLNISGVATATSNIGAESYLVFYALKPGTFDLNDYFAPANVLTGKLYSLGPVPANPTYPANFFQLPVAGNIVGSGNIPLSIPVTGLSSSFQVFIGLYSFVAGTTSSVPGAGWNIDYNKTLNFNLTAPAGVSLTSASGVFPVGPGEPTTVPEPCTAALLGGMLLVLAAGRLVRNRGRSHV